jgi:hypothetical protein
LPFLAFVVSVEEASGACNGTVAGSQAPIAFPAKKTAPTKTAPRRLTYRRTRSISLFD